MSKRWYKQFFNLKSTGKCHECGKSCYDIFCSTRCEKIFGYRNNFPEIERLRKFLSADLSTIKNRFLVNRDGEPKFTYSQRRAMKNYSEAWDRADSRARRLKELTEQVEFPQDC